MLRLYCTHMVVYIVPTKMALDGQSLICLGQKVPTVEAHEIQT
jgi:hypothetical protein